MDSIRDRYGEYGNSFKSSVQGSFTNDGTLFGDPNMNIDGSVTPADFYYESPENMETWLSEITFFFEGSTNNNYNDFGTIIGGLTNGITLHVEVGGFEVQLQYVLKAGSDFFKYNGRSSFVNHGGPERVEVYRFVFSGLSDGVYIGEGDKLIIRVNDDLSTLAICGASLNGAIRTIRAE